ncbi:MAG: hypothetical protein AAFX53_18390 [Bacteroidota bacterium]
MSVKVSLFTFFLITPLIWGQELGSNFNHNPEIMDFYYLEKAKVDWVRTTPRILDYVDGKLDINSDPGLQKVIEAGKRGYKVAFGFRWDFNMRKKRLPEPNSKEEQLYFEYARKLLKRVGPYVDVFKLGNEPNLETRPEDLQENENGIVPLVRFTKRQLTKVVLPYFKERDGTHMPDIYVGSFPRLFMKEEQQKAGVREMIKWANEDDRVTGLAVHLHISDTLQIDRSFEYVRSIMPTKPIIVPEFSLHRLYRKKLAEPLTINKAGKAFVQKYGLNPDWKLYHWFTKTNSQGVGQQEWANMFATRDWFPKHNFKIYYNRFEKFGVVLATYPLLQQSCPEKMTPESPAWFINPIFCQKSLVKNEQGDFSTNPLHFDDFVELVEKGKAKRNAKINR